jgi:hypothetical protein
MTPPVSSKDFDQMPAFCEGIQYFSPTLPDIDRLGDAPLL